MTEKLKPCPFCGRKDTEIEITQEFYSEPLYVQCPCGATLYGEFKTFRQAIEAWNRRVAT